MSTFGDYALQLLAGGLPAAIDYGTGVPANAQGDTGALSSRSASPLGAGERKAPTGTLQDRIPGLQTNGGLSGTTIAIGAVALVAVLGLVAFVARR